MQWGFVARKLQNGRIIMTSKELKLHLDSCGPEDAATILLLATLLRLESGKDQGAIGEALFFTPNLVPEHELRNYYNFFEDMINKANAQAAAFQKSQFGLPPLIRDQVKFTNHAARLWMVTIGAAIRRESLADAKYIWRKIEASLGSLQNATQRLKTIETQMGGTLLPNDQENLEREARRIPSLIY